MLNNNIRTIEDLHASFPEIHRIIASKSDDPCMPILAETDLEIELTLQLHEFAIENESLEHFPGMTIESITDIILNIHLKYQIIADIDGRGSLKHPRHAKEVAPQPHAPITDYLLDIQEISA